MADPKLVRFTYKNHKGAVAVRQVVPKKIHFGSTQWHSDEQWLLDAYDAVKGADRTFAMKDISGWVPYSEEADQP